MKSIKVIAAKRRVNKNTGDVISKFSVIPYGSNDDWELVSSGYTWEVINRNGTMTEGLCRKVAETKDEANSVAMNLTKLHPNLEVTLLS